MFSSFRGDARVPRLEAPMSAERGESIEARGTGFPADTDIQLVWNGGADGMPKASTDGAGAFRIQLTVPVATPPGDHQLGAMPHGTEQDIPSADPNDARSAIALASATIRVQEAGTPSPWALKSGPPSLTPVASPTPPLVALAPTAAPTPVPTPTKAAPAPTKRPAATPRPVSKAAPAPTRKPTPKPTAKPTAKPAPSGWTSIFRDDFNYTVARGSFPNAVSQKWFAYDKGWKDTSKNGTYDPSIVAVANGMLDVHIQTTNGVHRVAAFGPRFGSNNAQRYGRYEIRFRADSMPGYKAAWLLWPASGVWPRDGEIDFPEGSFNSTIDAFMHRQGATRGSDQDAFETGARFTSWHTAIIEWTPSAVRFYLDGKLIGTSTSRIPNTAMRWVIQNETNLSSSAPSSSVQGHVRIDYVQVWRYNG
jgi:beta-glucanase (GH16 family)